MKELIKVKTTILVAVLIFVTMSGIAIAEGDQTYGIMVGTCPNCNDITNMTYAQPETPNVSATSNIEENWAYGKRNVAPQKIEYVMYDFEEGSNCELPFDNQYPEFATFLEVPPTRLTPLGYGSDKPSYVRDNGSMCGTTRCVMRIYPYHNRGLDWIYIVNGNASFSPVTCCETNECWTGECYPGVNSKIEFREGTTYISFLASTGTRLYVRLYDKQNNHIGYGTIYRTIDRVGDEPSDFTRFSIHLPNKEISYMTLSGAFNGWHIDDLIIGGEPGYLDKPVNYTYVARLAEELYGVDYLKHGVGADYVSLDYMDPWQFSDGSMGEYWNPDTKQFDEGEGIGNAGLIFWAYNKDSGYLAGVAFVKQTTPAKMMKHDFKIDVDSADTQPGDVCFMDRDFDGYADEVYMVIEETDLGMNLICSDADSGVIRSKKSIVEDSLALMGYRRLPGVIKGGKNPIPKVHGIKINEIQEAIDAKGYNWTAGETSVSGLTLKEKKRMCGAIIAPPPANVQYMMPEAGATYPASFDWRNKDGKDWMTPVRNQGSCGSCWAFSALGTVEAMLNIHANDPDLDMDLSEQHLVSECCSAGSCGGGSTGSALMYVRDVGVPDEACFPYKASNCACTPCPNWAENVVKIESYNYVYNYANPATEDALKYALYEHGPVSVIIYVPDDWFYYKEGVYEPTCEVDEGVGGGYHAVVMTGWDDSGEYWIIKNSWGTWFGEKGYAKIKYGNLKYYAYAATISEDPNPNIPPVAEASANTTSGNMPLTVAFTGTGTDSDGTVISYAWVFGDGGFSVLQNPTYTYSNSGTYTATLTVTDDDGATGTDIVGITVADYVVKGWIRPVDASASSYANKRSAPTSAIDGIYKTYWKSGRADTDSCWIQFDIGEERNISKVRAYISRRCTPMAVNVSVSNDAANWNTVATTNINTSEVFTEIPCNGTNVRYIRLDETSFPKVGNCAEFEVRVCS